MSTPHFDTTIYSNSVSVSTTFLIGVSNWSLNILILWEEADWLWLISTDLLSMAKVCHTFWLHIKLADITQDTAVCFHTADQNSELPKLPLHLF